jgi:dihydroorotate dehydrogenase
MPDWSYHQLFKPALSLLPPIYSREFIHRGMSTIASLPGGHHIINFLGREESSKLLQKNIAGIQFPNPVGLSGKIDPLLSGTNAFVNLGFGFIEVGPITLRQKTSEEPPIVDKEHETIHFSHGDSIDLNQTIQKLKRIRFKQPVLIRLSGTMKDLQEMINALKDYADCFVLSYSELDRNPKGFLQTEKPIFLAVPVEEAFNVPIEEMKNFFSGVILEEMPREKNKFSYSQLLETVLSLKKQNPDFPIITVGGIIEPSNALTLMEAGADCVMLSSGYVFSGPGLTKRINEALLQEKEPKETEYKGWSWYWLFGFSIFLGGIIALIFSLTTVILPYDETFLGMKKESLLLFNKRILLFMAHDRMTLAGTMISGGIVYMSLARFGIRRGLLWAKQATDFAAIIGFLGILLFIGYGYFDWLHLLFWVVLLPFYLLGFVKTKKLEDTPKSYNRKNHSIWKRSLIGQLAFVMLGFSFVLGGIIISWVGVTSVFVPTDIFYICMSPEMLDSFNQKLLPVIAHDRAGFGSALLSVGLLVLTVSLWGFQQGNKWIWWTLFIGGLPAFIAGISIHIAIGYTTFIHLLPAYIAIGLFMIGLFYSYKFFHMKQE